MEELIARLDRWLRERRPDEYALLWPGVSDDVIMSLGRLESVTLPADFTTLYRWANGLATPYPEPCFTGWFALMPCYEIAFTTRMMKALEETEEGFGAFENWWNTSWIPFTSNGAGDHYCVDMAGTFGGHSGQVIEFVHDDDSRTILHESIQKWLETVVEVLERDVAYYNEDFSETVEYTALFTEVNPGYPKEFHAPYLGERISWE